MAQGGSEPPSWRHLQQPEWNAAVRTREDDTQERVYAHILSETEEPIKGLRATPPDIIRIIRIPFANKLACIWIPRRDPRARTFQPFNNFGFTQDELWFSYEEVSVKGLKIDILDAGDHDDSEDEHDSDSPNSDDDDYDRALTVAERVAIANETNDDEAGPMETEVVDAGWSTQRWSAQRWSTSN